MRDIQVAQFLRSSEACAAKATARAADAPAWARLAKCWEFLAQVHEEMPVISVETPDVDQGERQNVGIIISRLSLKKDR